MYVDSSEGCNELAFTLGMGGAAAMRQWNIKVTQYSCDYPNLAPSGCTEYFFGGNGEGMIQTYNFEGGQHLANQRQKFCIRYEKSP